MVYTVRQLARLAGVSARTLHYYDHIGLLKPASYGPNGYRRYGEEEAVLQQQILFFRELGFSLGETKAIVSRPDFAVRDALEAHRTMLRMKAERIAELLDTVDHTIRGLQGDVRMEIREYYQGLSDEKIEEYRSEVRRRWGEGALADSEARVVQMGKEGYAAHQAKGDAIFEAMAGMMSRGPASPEVQEQIAMWRTWLEAFSSYSDEAVLGLGRMYSQDARSAAYFSKHHPDLPAFFTGAVEYYCSNTTKRGQLPEKPA